MEPSFSLSQTQMNSETLPEDFHPPKTIVYYDLTNTKVVRIYRNGSDQLSISLDRVSDPIQTGGKFCGVLLENGNGVNILSEVKLVSLQIHNSENIFVQTLEPCIQGLGFYGCKKVSASVFESVGVCTVEKCSDVKLNFEKECDYCLIYSSRDVYVLDRSRETNQEKETITPSLKHIIGVLPENRMISEGKIVPICTDIEAPGVSILF
jgi:hypothetical protein